MGICSVFGCKNRSNRNVSETFHRFPTDTDTNKQQLHKWIQACGRKNFKPKKNSFICSKHFENNVFLTIGNRTFLKSFAVPTIRLPVTASSDMSATTDLEDKVDLEKYVKREQDPLEILEPTTSSTSGVHPSISQLSSTSGHSPTLSGIKRQKIHTKKKLKVEIDNKLKRLELRLQRKSFLAEQRLKKLRAIRQAYRRLNKRNAELTQIITKLQMKCLTSSHDADVLNTSDTENKDNHIVEAKPKMYLTIEMGRIVV